MSDSPLRQLNDLEIALAIHVKPGKTKEYIELSADGKVTLFATAKAHKGQANKSVVELLSKVFGCPKRDLDISRGETSAHKEIRIKNQSMEKLRQKLLAYVRQRGIKP